MRVLRMPESLRRILCLHRVRPVTRLDVAAAQPEPEKDALVTAAAQRTEHEVHAVEMRSWEIRRNLAEGVVKIVSGET